jgi:hypothetical protein
MKVLACDVNWTVSGGVPTCTGTLQNIDANQIPSGMTTEDATELAYQAMGLFAVVFAVLAIKKAIN